MAEVDLQKVLTDVATPQSGHASFYVIGTTLYMRDESGTIYPIGPAIGTAGYVPRFIGTNKLGQGSMTDDGTNISMAGSLDLGANAYIQTASGYLVLLPTTALYLRATTTSPIYIGDATANPVNIGGGGGAVTTANLNVGAATGATAGQVLASDRVSQLLPFATYTAPVNQTTSGVTIYTCTIDEAATILRWEMTFDVITTNSSASYWQVDLYRIDTGAVLATFNTYSVGGADTWLRYASGAISIALTTAMKGIGIKITKAGATGTPGAFNGFGPAVYVQ